MPLCDCIPALTVEAFKNKFGRAPVVGPDSGWLEGYAEGLCQTIAVVELLYEVLELPAPDSLRTDIALSSIKTLKSALQAEENAHLRALEERDEAEDALQKTHIKLGGDGEWVGKMPSQCPPDSGDLRLDVPALAKERMQELSRLRALVDKKTSAEDIKNTGQDEEDALADACAMQFSS